MLAEEETKDEERPLEILAAFSMRLQQKETMSIKEATSIEMKRSIREHPYCSHCGARGQEEQLPIDGSDVPSAGRISSTAERDTGEGTTPAGRSGSCKW